MAVDAVFIAAYFLAGVASADDAGKVAFTVAWTAITLLIVLRGLTRIRSIRTHRQRDSSS